MAQLDVRVADRRPGETFDDRRFLDAASLSETQPLQSLLAAAGIPPAQHADWEAIDVEGDALSEQRLLQLRSLECSIVILRRQRDGAGAGGKRKADGGPSGGGKKGKKAAA